LQQKDCLLLPAHAQESIFISFEDSIAALKKERKRYYLDSMQNQTVYNLGAIKYTYKECNEKQVRLGLES
jgi:hypothetical protein